MKRIALAAALALASSAALAQPYVSAGVSRVKVDGEGHNTPTIALGYSIGKHFAVEVGAFQPGEVTTQTSATLVSPTQQDFSSRERSLNGYRLSALLSMPLTAQASAFASVSAYRLKAKHEALDQSIALPGGALLSRTTSSFSSTATLPAIGVGLRYDFTTWFAARASFERIDPKAGMFGPGNDVDKIDVRTLEFVFSF